MYGEQQLISGINCVPQDAFREFMNTKALHGKQEGRMFYQMLQSFHPVEKVTPAQAHEIAVRFAQEQFPGYEIVVATHTDRQHIHSHFVINSVNLDTGLKYHSNTESLQQLRNASDALCREYGLEIIQPKHKKTPGMGAREYRAAVKGQSWKLDMAIAIDRAMEMADSPEHFIRLMEWEGYEVKWTAERKNITYTTPAGYKCRGGKLHEPKYRKERMEYEFAIRAALRNRNEGETETDAGESRKRYPHRSGDGTQLAGDDRLSGITGGNSDGYSHPAGYADHQGGTGRLHESATGIFDDRADSHEENLRGVPGGDAEAGKGNEMPADGGWKESGETGWEDARAVWQSTYAGAGKSGQAYKEAVSDLSDSQFDFASAGSDAAYLAADLFQLIDGSPETEEERRKRMEAQQTGSTLGAIAGLAIGAAVALYEQDRDEKNQEPVQQQMEGM